MAPDQQVCEQEAERDVRGGRERRHLERVPNRRPELGIRKQRRVVLERELRRKDLRRPGAFLNEGDQDESQVREQEQAHCAHSEEGQEPPRPRRANGAPWGGNALPYRGELLTAFEPSQRPKECERRERERDRLDHRERDFAVHPTRDDLRREHSEPATEHVGGRERRHRRHEDEHRCGAERRGEHRKRDLEEHAEPARSKRFGRLSRGRVEPGEAGGDEQVKVDVHRIGVDEEDGRPTHHAPRRGLEAQGDLHQPCDHPALPVEEEK